MTGAGAPVVLLVNLVQDVAVLHPLVRLCAAQGWPVTLHLTPGFRTRDPDGRWYAELQRLAQQTGATLHAGSPTLAPAGFGVAIAASESSLPAHAETHAAWRAAPPDWLTVTLQHGYECVGFLHGHGHDVAHGTAVGFAADVLAGWMPAPRLTALRPDERAKLVVTGPTAALDPPPAPGAAPRGGLIAENIQSARLTSGPERFADRYRAAVIAFVIESRAAGRDVCLRPHPSGLGMARALPDGLGDVAIDDAPVWQGTLARYAWAISPPSSVVIDLIRARVPVAVWNGESAAFDTRNYGALPRVGGIDDWRRFADAAAGPGRADLLAGQEQFLRALAMPDAPDEVARRYLRLIAAGRAGPRIAATQTRRVARRIAVVAPMVTSHLEATLLATLAPYANADALAVTTRAGHRPLAAPADIDRLLAGAPDVMIVADPEAGALRSAVRSAGVPVVDWSEERMPLIAPPFTAPPPQDQPARLGWLATGAIDDATAALLAALLEAHDALRLDVISAGALPPELIRYGDRVTALAPIRPLRAGRVAIAARGWTIALIGADPLDWLTVTAAGCAPVRLAPGVDSAGELAALLADDAARIVAAQRAQETARATYAADAGRIALDRALGAVGLRLSRLAQSVSNAA